MVIGRAKGDMHDIDKNLVKMMMESKSIEVIDLRANVSAEKFVETAIRENADIIACSALMTTTMNQMENIVTEVEKRGIRDKIKIMIDGVPVNQEFCDFIKADIYTSNAASAIEEVGKKGTIKLVSYDVDNSLIAQNSWSEGFWSLQFLYQAYNGKLDPSPGWKASGENPLPPSVNAGISVVTTDNNRSISPGGLD